MDAQVTRPDLENNENNDRGAEEERIFQKQEKDLREGFIPPVMIVLF